uniref:UPF0716 protein FxsA n=1 Tax=Candidatus Kentrum sp. FW TaxID=2126338 RepID=A0A450T7A7_9GAMM|nr:MAG: UPF0716 protein FxsA [Candidatus Kentron sp. FW]
MRAFHLLFFFFVLTPVVEIYFLMEVGSVIGVWPTVVLVVATAVIGAYLVKQQGLSTLFRIQGDLSGYEGDSSAPDTFVALLEGVLILIAGALLLTPGFLTDTVGFVCLVPPWRRAMVSRFLPHWNVVSPTRSSHAYRGTEDSGGSVIEGNFRQEEE